MEKPEHRRDIKEMISHKASQERTHQQTVQSNYGIITLFSMSGKVFERITLERMTNRVDSLVTNQQAGLHQNRPGVDQIAALQSSNLKVELCPRSISSIRNMHLVV